MLGRRLEQLRRVGALHRPIRPLREGQEPALAVWSANVSSIETPPLEMERLAAQSRGGRELRTITGTPGAVKTRLINAVAAAYRAEGYTVSAESSHRGRHHAARAARNLWFAAIDGALAGAAHF